MAERAHIPSSPACGDWETLLTDALDGLLKPEDEAKFMAHKAACPACAALYDEARKGREWLEFLSPEPEVPAGLLEKILASTGSGRKAPAPWTVGGALPLPAGAGAVLAFVPPVWQRPGFFARARQTVQPRLLMTAAMAFFSIALTLNLAGVRLTTLRLADLRPKAVRSYMERQLNMASVPIVRYYDHLRVVYEVESTVRDLRSEADGQGNGEPQHNQTQPATPGQTPRNPEQKPGDGGFRVDPRQQPGHSNPDHRVPDDRVMEPAAIANEPLEASLSFESRSLEPRSFELQSFEPQSSERESDFTSRPAFDSCGPEQSSGSQLQRAIALVGDIGSAKQAWERSREWTA